MNVNTLLYVYTVGLIISTVTSLALIIIGGVKLNSEERFEVVLYIIGWPVFLSVVTFDLIKTIVNWNR